MNCFSMKTCIIFLGFWLCVVNVSNGQTRFTLEEAIDYALKSHSSMQVADMEGDDALLAYKEAKAVGMPHVSIDSRYVYNYSRPRAVIEDFISPVILGILNQTSLAPEVNALGSDAPTTFEAGFTRRHQFTTGLNASVFVFNGNYLKGLKVGRMFIDLARRQKLLTEQQIKINVTRAYHNVLIAKKNIETFDNNISNISKLSAAAQISYDNGFVEQLDVDRLILSKEILKNEKNKFLRVLEVSNNLLKYEMAFPLDQKIDAVDHLERGIDAILSNSIDLKDTIDLEQRPEYTLLEEAIELDEGDLQRIKKGYLPSVYADFSFEESLLRDKLFNRQETFFLPNGFLGISANIPIYDGGDTKSKIQRKKIVLEKRKIELDEFKRGLILQIFNARTRLINAKESLEFAKRTNKLSEKIYEKTVIKFNEGVGSSLEVTQAESDLYQSQADHISALYDILVAKSDLDVATGEINYK